MRVLFWLAVLACACTPHERDDEVLVEAPSAEPMPDMPALAPVQPPEVPACEPAVADVPTPLFGERLLIRPPEGVVLVEENPTFAMAAQSGGFVVTCDAELDRMTLMIFENDPDKSLHTYGRELVEMLERGGFVGAREMEWSAPADRRIRGTVTIPATDALPSATLLVDVARRHELVVVTTYVAHSEDFARLEPTLHMSADSLLLVPPR